ncbi:carbohydrate ABC transporter permease [Cohnella herbarum]|uniref:Sugar ABC transporter permease n=1 Tax=Cohnella herbarum TaxID=2728023 RepID=A0A7Z2ZM21_9BACL|nr:sugar ABC transporter permease [Cohnella herbarum]QJD84891.1 sugar ABC transporter permease [Cohnella herbarum]
MPTSRRLKWFIFIGLTPAVSIFVVFAIAPMIWSMYYGFYDWSGIGDSKFIKLENYKETFGDPVFWKALKNNMIVVVASVFGQVPIALVLALALRKTSLFQRIVRGAVFLPMVLSSVVIGMIWQYMYHPQVGILNFALEWLHLGSLKRQWLGDPDIAMYSLTVPIIWNYVGLYLLLFMAALSNTPAEVDDAAKIDGASGLKKLFLVTLPMIRGTIQVAVILCIAGSLKAFDLVFVMTGGGPAHGTELLATYMYNNTFNIYRFGYGSAISTVTIFISFIFIAISQLLLRRDQRQQ